jgi:hypothetical protein
MPKKYCGVVWLLTVEDCIHSKVVHVGHDMYEVKMIKMFFDYFSSPLSITAFHHKYPTSIYNYP